MEPAFFSIFSKFLVKAWERFNQELLQGALKPPQFELSSKMQPLGSWSSQKRLIAISYPFIANSSVREVEDVLRHEMAHQYVDEVLNLEGTYQAPHGDAFRYACKRLKIGHSARYSPSFSPSPHLERIQKLLALATSANRHEAELAMAKAQQLMQKYELELGYEDCDFRCEYLGGSRRQRSMTDVMIAGILVKFFQVRAIWITTHEVGSPKKRYLLEISGTTTQLRIAGYVWDFLQYEVEILWKSHRQKYPGIGGRSDKHDFVVGVLQGLREKLAMSERVAEQAEQSEPSRNRELVLLKASKLDDFMQERYPNMVKGTSRGYRLSSRFYEGYEHGQKLDIHKGLAGKEEIAGKLTAGKS